MPTQRNDSVYSSLQISEAVLTKCVPDLCDFYLPSNARKVYYKAWELLKTPKALPRSR